jgi:dephospho-CoA kinase
VITIGLTGSIAAGKSEVAKLLATHGATVVDADRVAHETYAPGTDGIGQLTAAFGPGILAEDGSVDRRKLGAAVFGDPAKLAQLSGIVWPLTRRRVEALQAEALAAGVPVFVIEAPLLVEAGWLDLVDQVWFVKATGEVALERLRGRGHSEEDARARLASRPAIEQAEAAAQVIIDNSGSLEALQQRVDQLWSLLHNEAR